MKLSRLQARFHCFQKPAFTQDILRGSCQLSIRRTHIDWLHVIIGLIKPTQTAEAFSVTNSARRLFATWRVNKISAAKGPSNAPAGLGLHLTPTLLLELAAELSGGITAHVPTGVE